LYILGIVSGAAIEKLRDNAMTHNTSTHQHSRRDFLAASLAAVSLGQTALGNNTTFKPGKAKSVIQIWMWGGPSHLDTFDPKPDAGRDYCGQWDKPITTNVPSIEISQSLPMLAQCADHYSIIRSVTHGTNHHEMASYMMQTGRRTRRKSRLSSGCCAGLAGM
jgi:hypothetical protein